jgi:hypothetical protein
VRLVRVVAPHFVAGFGTDRVVRRAALIIRYMVGWSEGRAREYLARKGWYALVLVGQRLAGPGNMPVRKKSVARRLHFAVACRARVVLTTEADIPCAKISVGSAIFRRASCDGFHASTWQRPHSALVGQALDDVYWA